MAVMERRDVTGGLALGANVAEMSPALAVFPCKIGELGFPRLEKRPPPHKD